MSPHKKNGERTRVFRKLQVAVGLVGSLLWLSSALAAPPQLAIDHPSAGQHVSGLFNILGWAVGITAPIDFVEVSFDGGSPTPVGYGGARNDVGAAFPAIPDASLSGYALGFNARLLTNGVHQMTVRAVDMNGEEASRRISVLVSNAPGAENPRTVELDFSDAGLEPVGKTEILAQEIKVDGQPVTSVLKYDRSSSQLVPISFVADQDDDGVRDDDRDADGFADNDLDRDGFPDDDLDRNGLSDNDNDDDDGVNTNENGNTNTNDNSNTNSNDNSNSNENGNTNTNDNSNSSGNTNTNDNDNSNDDDDD